MVETKKMITTIRNKYRQSIYNNLNFHLFYKKYINLDIITYLTHYIKNHLDTINDKFLLYGLYHIYKWNKNIPYQKKIEKRIQLIENNEINNIEKQTQLIELTISEIQEKNKSKNIHTINQLLEIVVSFIKNKKLICYGGQAINNILPKKHQFYKDNDIPDYDFFSSNAKQDAIELSNIFFNQGYQYIEVKEAIHKGTFKVFVEFEGVADITYIPEYIFLRMYETSIIINGIHYVSPNILRMGLYIELSRPNGDISRWNKLYSRLQLLNKYYPMEYCAIENRHNNTNNKTIIKLLYKWLENKAIILFGHNAFHIYHSIGNYQSFNKFDSITNTFYLLSINFETDSNLLYQWLSKNNIKNLKKTLYSNIMERVPDHYCITNDKNTIAIIFDIDSCYSYHVFQKLKIGTIETLLRFYFAFEFLKREYLDNNSILCMAYQLLELQKKNPLDKNGIFKKFTIKCLGHQDTIKELKRKKWHTKKFFYRPKKLTKKTFYKD